VIVTDPKETNTVDYRNCKRCDDYTIRLYKVTSRADGRQIDVADDNGYCIDCAEKRQRELLNSDERSRTNKAAKRGENLTMADCTAIAVAKVTGAPYTSVRAYAKRTFGVDLNTRGLHLVHWEMMLKHFAAKRGLKVTTLEHPLMEKSVSDILSNGVKGKSLAEYVQEHSKARLAFSCELGGSGHAIPAVNGKAFNSNSNWNFDATVKAAWLVEKA
jgi:hypothetical protein